MWEVIDGNFKHALILDRRRPRLIRAANVGRYRLANTLTHQPKLLTGLTRFRDGRSMNGQQRAPI